MTKLTIDEILDQAVYDLEWVFPNVQGSPYVDRNKQGKVKDEAKAQLLQLLSDSMDSLIGEDRVQKSNDFTTDKSYNITQKYLDAENRLRAEQRQCKILIIERLK